jgi:3-deoxy-D-manno-octulosonate 8-phosphate phosphatase (KDO 8-P phosphatase)
LKIFIDIDGTLTDGKMYIDHRGEKMFKAFHARDVRAIRELIVNGYDVTLVTADDHESGKHFAHKVGADYECMRDKGKLGPSEYAIGDDTWDVAMMEGSRLAFCPADADPVAKRAADIILNTNGGQGVIAEMIHHILNVHNGYSLPDRQGQPV